MNIFICCMSAGENLLIVENRQITDHGGRGDACYIYIYTYTHIHRYVQPETCARTTDVMLLVSPSRWPTPLQSHPTPEPAAICSPHLSAKQQRNPRGRSQSCLCPPRRSSGPCTACKTCEVTTIARVRISVSVSEPTRHKNKKTLDHPAKQSCPWS